MGSVKFDTFLRVNFRVLPGLLAAIVFAVLLVSCSPSVQDVERKREDLANSRRLFIAGSSTMAPFMSSAAEYFGAVSEFPTPVVESVGTGGGFQIFCRGTDLSTSSIATASRPIKPAERAHCHKNGVTDIIELKFGYDGITFVHALRGPEISLSRSDLYLALSQLVPDENGAALENPLLNWSEIRSDLPDLPIRVIGPPPSSGTRDAFVEMVLRAGARQLPELAALDTKAPKQFNDLTAKLRTDGIWQEGGENDTGIVQALIRDTKAFGIVGFNYLAQNSDRIAGVPIDGVTPSRETISSGEYSITRPLYLYVKTDHFADVPALMPFLLETYGETAMGPKGYLLEKGLVPLKPSELKSALAELGRERLAGKALVQQENEQPL